MAKTLSNSGITSLGTVRPGHVSQSVDALTGAEAYDITISGSLTVTGSLNFNGGVTGSSFTGSFVGDGSGLTNLVSSSYALTASYALNGGGGGGNTFPYTGSATISGSLTVIGPVNFNGGVTGSSFTGSFSGNGENITNIVSSSYALTASYALNGGGGGSSNLQTVMDIGSTWEGTSDVSISFIGASATHSMDANDTRGSQIISNIGSGLSATESYFRANVNFGGGTQMVYNNGPFSQFLSFNGSSMVVRDTINSKGLVYLSDYSSNFTNRSLVDKEYVDSLSSYTGSFTGSFIGDGSGLTGVGGNSFPYTGSAIISGSLTVTGSLNVSGSSAFFNNFNTLEITGSIELTGSNVDFKGATQVELPQTTIESGSLVLYSTSGSLSGSVDIDWGASNNFKYTLNNYTTASFINDLAGQSINVAIEQTGSGGGLTVLWPSTVKWQGGNVPSQTAGTGSTDVYSFIKIEDTVYGSVIQNFL